MTSKKLPDFSELTKKLGIDDLVESVKAGARSVMSGVTSTAPSRSPHRDEIMAQFTEISILLQELSKTLITAQKKVEHLAKEVQFLQNAPEQHTTTGSPQATQAPSSKSGKTLKSKSESVSHHPAKTTHGTKIKEDENNSHSH